MCDKSFQSCQTHCDPMDCGPVGSSAHGVSRQEYQSRYSCLEEGACPPPGDLPHAGMDPPLLMSPALSGGSLTQGWTPLCSCLLHRQVGPTLLVPPGKPTYIMRKCKNICQNVFSCLNFIASAFSYSLSLLILVIGPLKI